MVPKNNMATNDSGVSRGGCRVKMLWFRFTSASIRHLEKRILRLHKGGTGILKIGKALGIGTGTVQRVLMEQPRPFDVDVAEAAYASQWNGAHRALGVEFPATLLGSADFGTRATTVENVQLEIPHDEATTFSTVAFPYIIAVEADHAARQENYGAALIIGNVARHLTESLNPTVSTSGLPALAENGATLLYRPYKGNGLMRRVRRRSREDHGWVRW
jgi:hypothetical protein